MPATLNYSEPFNRACINAILAGWKPLTRAQRDVLADVAHGQLSKCVAAARGTSVRAIECHLAEVRRKLRCQTTIHAVYLALKAGIIE